MKRAVSSSLGSSVRDHTVVLDLLGERVSVERIGTNALEAALTAVAGKGCALTSDEIKGLLDQLSFPPGIVRLN